MRHIAFLVVATLSFPLLSFSQLDLETVRTEDTLLEMSSADSSPILASQVAADEDVVVITIVQDDLPSEAFGSAAVFRWNETTEKRAAGLQVSVTYEGKLITSRGSGEQTGGRRTRFQQFEFERLLMHAWRIRSDPVL